MRERLWSILPLVWLATVLLLTFVMYQPGLHGGFLFDDFANLPALGATGPIEGWPTFWRYITSGVADPTGRPLTLLTFLLDAHNWPADPYPFKVSNLILHLLNGVLLAALLRRLGLDTFGRATQGRVEMAAVLGAAFWLLHPLLVSTTLYIVQREAMLPATFTLLGLLLWLRGRSALQGGRTASGLIWVSLGLGGCTVLGVLSKANGILLPALALAIEYVLLRHATKRPVSANSLPRPQTEVSVRSPPTEHEDSVSVGPSRRMYTWAMTGFAWLPAIFVAGYLANSAWKGFFHGVSALRPWTMGQRLLTEPRVLMRYLDLLWLPRPFTPGLFNDQIEASHSLWLPGTTLPALLALLGLIVGAWCWRKRWPAVALAILFFFVGQSLESSTIPLELYFEHRNYLPAVLMFWPLALWLCGVQQGRQSAAALGSNGSDPQRAMKGFRRGVHDRIARHHQQGRCRQSARLTAGALRIAWAKGLLAITLLLGLSLMTHARAQLWGNTRDQALLWATLNPDSPRAQTNAALLEMANGQPKRATTRLESLLRAQPNQVQLALNLITAHCMLGALGPDDSAQARYAMAHTRNPGGLLVHWFELSIPAAVSHQCRGLDLHTLDLLLDSGLTNEILLGVNGRQQDMLYLQGVIAIARHNPAEALLKFNAALNQNVRPAAALEQAALLGSSGYPNEGLAHLVHYEAEQHRQVEAAFGMPRVHAWVLQHQAYWPREIAHLRDALTQDVKTKVTNGK